MINNKTAIITGASSGIGKAIVEVFSKNGANIWACARTKTKELEEFNDKLSKENSVTIKNLYFDFNNETSIKEAFEIIRKSKEQIDILVNVAGIVFNANFLMTKREDCEKIFSVNYFAQMQWTQYVLKLMLKQKKGSIVNIASTGAIDGNMGRFAYNSSKAALIAATKTMAQELGTVGIRINAIAPGLVDTRMARENTPETVLKERIQNTCLKRIGQAEEIANTAMFLASDLSSYITGQTLRVDGGMY